MLIGKEAMEGTHRPSQLVCLAAVYLSAPLFSLSFSMSCTFGPKVQWEVELTGDEEKNKVALLCGDV